MSGGFPPGVIDRVDQIIGTFLSVSIASFMFHLSSSVKKSIHGGYFRCAWQEPLLSLI